jgi:putative acetyltransferase
LSGVDVRPEAARDAADIRSVVEEAFGQAAEADLVDRLRSDGDLVMSLVAVSEGIIGYAAFSPVAIDGSSAAAVALAPVAVRPPWQRRGVGTALIRDGLRRLAANGVALAVVVGDPDYYGRFGFSRELAAGLKTPYDAAHVLALPLAGRPTASGKVRYARAFATLG